MGDDASALRACAICKRAPGKRHLSVDHDHRTQEVRGLLCQRCNALLEVHERLKDEMVNYLLNPPNRALPTHLEMT